MLFDHKDPHIIINEIKMISSSGACVVVEGPEDYRFWMSRKHGGCELVHGGGKCNVLGAVRILNDRGCSGILGIVDDDYDTLLMSSKYTDNVVVVRPHSLESLLCLSSALPRVLSEYGDASKIRAFEHNHSVGVRDALFERAAVFGRIRWVARAFGLSVKSGSINIPRFLDQRTWEIDEARLIEVASSDVKGGLRRYLRQLPTVEPAQVARGHDLIEVLRIGLQRVLGDLPANKGTDDIARSLRLAMEDGELSTTELWSEILLWEERNSPYRVLHV